MSDYQCAQCSSDQIQKLSMVYESGASVINTTTRGSSTGVGFAGGGFGVGSAVNTSRTKGTQMTEAAKRAAPPAKKPFVQIILLGLFLAFLCSFMSMTVAFLILAGAGAMAYFSYKFNNEEFPGLWEAWNKSWMCQRCGSIFSL